MKNYFKNKIKERLTYCKEWKNSVDIYLASKEVTKKTNEEYYKSKPLLKLILDVYFIPYNMLRFFRYLRMVHEYKKNQVEIMVLSKELNENNKREEL
tara:strand:- start:146 stop:436 length:291 start_codon:yes stop_codon:yes gene_type:complete